MLWFKKYKGYYYYTNENVWFIDLLRLPQALKLSKVTHIPKDAQNNEVKLRLFCSLHDIKNGGSFYPYRPTK